MSSMKSILFAHGNKDTKLAYKGIAAIQEK